MRRLARAWAPSVAVMLLLPIVAVLGLVAWVISLVARAWELCTELRGDSGLGTT